SFEIPNCDLGPAGAGRKPQLLSGARGSAPRLARAQRVGDRSPDRERVEIGDGARRHAHLDGPALALDLDHTAPPQPALEASVPSTPSTWMLAVADLTHTVAPRGTRTSMSAPVPTAPSIPSFRTCASPAA